MYLSELNHPLWSFLCSLVHILSVKRLFCLSISSHTLTVNILQYVWAKIKHKTFQNIDFKGSMNFALTSDWS